MSATDTPARRATEALRELIDAYRGALPRKSNDQRLAAADEAYRAARASIESVDVSEVVDSSVDELIDGTGATASSGLDVLGTIDLTRLRADDLEVRLSAALGFRREEFDRYVRMARRALSRARRHGVVISVQRTDVLVTLLGFAHEAFYDERDRRRRGWPGRSRAWRKRVEGPKREHAEETIFGLLYAVGIIIANADYAAYHFARSYFIGSGVAVCQM